MQKLKDFSAFSPIMLWAYNPFPNHINIAKFIKTRYMYNHKKRRKIMAANRMFTPSEILEQLEKEEPIIEKLKLEIKSLIVSLDLLLDILPSDIPNYKVDPSLFSKHEFEEMDLTDRKKLLKELSKTSVKIEKTDVGKINLVKLYSDICNELIISIKKLETSAGFFQTRKFLNFELTGDHSNIIEVPELLANKIPGWPTATRVAQDIYDLPEDAYIGFGSNRK